MTSTPQPNGIHSHGLNVANASPVPVQGAASSASQSLGLQNARSISNPAQSGPSQPHAQMQSQTDPSSAALNGSGTGAGASSPRPHDARTIHLILASLGVTAYQDRVPLQLLDFAYRYTAGILGDAAHLAAEGYTGPDTTGTSGAASGRGAKNKQTNEGDVTLPALRLATSSRLGYQFAGSLPKQALLEVAEERNRIRLPDVAKAKVFGVRLPEERFLLTGRNWGIMEEGAEGDVEADLARSETSLPKDEVGGEKVDDKGEDEEMAEEDEDDGFDDVFGNNKDEEDEAT